ncbi:MAG: DUF2905 domain-containing protein [Anaerolineae bacterium]|nr:DUF2905 domain-containing protein [Anaerolineae bacterium]
MEGLEWIGRVMVIGGLATAVVGGMLWLLSRIPGLQQLPGTVRIESRGVTCLVPILASILLSVLLTVVLNVIVRLLNR